MTNPKKRLEKIIRQLMHDELDNDSPVKYEKNIQNTINKILKEFVHKKNLPKELDIVTTIVNELVRYRTDERFKFNARMSGKNWTLANWLAKAIRKLIEGKKNV